LPSRFILLANFVRTVCGLVHDDFNIRSFLEYRGLNLSCFVLFSLCFIAQNSRSFSLSIELAQTHDSQALLAIATSTWAALFFAVAAFLAIAASTSAATSSSMVAVFAALLASLAALSLAVFAALLATLAVMKKHLNSCHVLPEPTTKRLSNRERENHGCKKQQ